MGLIPGLAQWVKDPESPYATGVALKRKKEKKKEGVVYIHNGIVCGHQKWNLATCVNMDEPWGC